MAERLTKVDISLLKENPDNPRTITDAKFAQLVESVKNFPQMLEVRPIAFKTAPDGTRLVLGGNMRLRACIAAGLKEVPAIDLSGMTEAQQREFVIKDNVGYGGWDWEAIQSDWPEAEEWGLDIPDAFKVLPEAGEDDYEIPAEIETDIVLGDLFEIGEHRLMCGDAKDSDAVSKLMNGMLADLVVTDPPYNTGMKKNKDAKARLSQMFCDSFTPEEWEELKTASFNNYNLFTKGECALYVFIDWRRVSEFKEVVESIADVKNVIVWDKGVHGLGSDYKSTYENIVVGKKGKPQINNRIGLDYQDIWRVQRKMGRDDEHATKKPVELISKPITHACKQDDIVLDLFLGSGTTMVAAHQLNRKCYGMEIDPKYCQVIVDRMLKLDPSITIIKNGVPLPNGSKKEIVL